MGIDGHHDSLEAEVVAFCQEQGGIVGKAGYHDIYPAEMHERLAEIFSPTSLHVRTRSDQIVLFPNGIVVEWEAKTRTSGGRDLAVEALPFCRHLLEYRELGVWCLYIFDHQPLEKNGAFWVHEAPRPLSADIPHRFRRGESFFRRVIETNFPDTPIGVGGRTNGSDDPYFWLDAEGLLLTPPWREVIAQMATASADSRPAQRSEATNGNGGSPVSDTSVANPEAET